MQKFGTVPNFKHLSRIPNPVLIVLKIRLNYSFESLKPNNIFKTDCCESLFWCHPAAGSVLMAAVCFLLNNGCGLLFKLHRSAMKTATERAT